MLLSGTEEKTALRQVMSVFQCAIFNVPVSARTLSDETDDKL